MKLQVLVVKGYSFTGLADGRPIEGEFSLEWDDNIPMAVVDSLGFVDGPDIPLANIDELALAEQIEAFECTTWYEDRQGRLVDEAMSRFED